MAQYGNKLLKKVLVNSPKASLAILTLAFRHMPGHIPDRSAISAFLGGWRKALWRKAVAASRKAVTLKGSDCLSVATAFFVGTAYSERLSLEATSTATCTVEKGSGGVEEGIVEKGIVEKDIVEKGTPGC